MNPRGYYSVFTKSFHIHVTYVWIFSSVTIPLSLIQLYKKFHDRQNFLLFQKIFQIKLFHTCSTISCTGQAS